MRLFASILLIHVLALMGGPTMALALAEEEAVSCETTCCMSGGEEQTCGDTEEEQPCGPDDQNCCKDACGSCSMCCFCCAVISSTQTLAHPFDSSDLKFRIRDQSSFAGFNGDTWRPPKMV